MDKGHWKLTLLALFCSPAQSSPAQGSCRVGAGVLGHRERERGRESKGLGVRSKGVSQITAQCEGGGVQPGGEQTSVGLGAKYQGWEPEHSQSFKLGPPSWVSATRVHTLLYGVETHWNFHPKTEFQEPWTSQWQVHSLSDLPPLLTFLPHPSPQEPTLL